MRLTRIAAIALLGIVLISTIACGSTPEPTLISDASELISPEPGATIRDNTPLFTWTSVTNDVTNYQFQVATDPSFGTMVVDLFLGDINVYEADNELANGTYYWRVKGISSTIETFWSELGSFVIDA